MSVKIFIKRNVPGDRVAELNVLLQRLRGVTLMQPGYISGQTLTRLDQPGECMVISTWHSLEYWQNWLDNPKRIAIQNEIDDLLGQKTSYSVYE